MHYFSPVQKMPLLEVITHGATDPSVVATASSSGKKQGKTVIVVNDGPGFYTSRILAPYMNEAAHLLVEGADIDAVDAALRAWGFPVGPVQLLDEVGIDVGEKVEPRPARGVRRADDAARARWPTLVADGRLGRKAKKGFYRYDVKGKPVDTSVYELAARRRDPGARSAEDEMPSGGARSIVNEAVRCLEEGILRSARDGDVGAIFGLGFPPFRGGPFRAMRRHGRGRDAPAARALAGAKGRPLRARAAAPPHGRARRAVLPGLRDDTELLPPSGPPRPRLPGSHRAEVLHVRKAMAGEARGARSGPGRACAREGPRESRGARPWSPERSADARRWRTEMDQLSLRLGAD